MGSVYQPGEPPRTRRISSPYGLMLLLVACLGLGLWGATAYVARGFGFHANLGPAWFVLSREAIRLLSAAAVLLFGLAVSVLVLSSRARRPARLRRLGLPAVVFAVLVAGASAAPVVYHPMRFVGWAIAYQGLSEASPYFKLFNEGLLFGGVVFAAAAAVVMVARQESRSLKETGSHGTASWSDGKALMIPRGLLVGRKHGGREGTSKLLRYDGEGHLITVAPTRSGKGVGGVIPNLLSYPGSAVVTDPKGENYAVTARYRRTRLGQEVFALDPFDQLGRFGLVPSNDSFNPMDLIDPQGPDLLESAGLLADMLVLPHSSGGGEDTFWTEEAKALLSGLLLFVAVDTDEARRRRMDEAEEHLRALLEEPDPPGRTGQRAREEAIREARDELRARRKREEGYLGRTLMEVRRLLTLPKDEFALLMQDMLRCTEAGGMVARSAARHTQKADKERSSVISTAQSNTHFLDSPRMARVLRSSDALRLSGLKQRRVTLYLILPAHYLDTYSRWLRLMIACALHELARAPGKPAERVLFLLDEFANLGRMDPVLRAVSLLAGYGVSIWMFLQDLSQLKGTYPEKWGTFLANADVFQAFGTNDYDTSRYLSDLTGDATIFVASENQSRSRSHGRHISRGQGLAHTYSEKSRKLLLPDEVRRMETDQQLLFVRGMEPLLATKINYLHDSEFYEPGDGRQAPGPLWRRLLMRLKGAGRPADRLRPVFDDNPMFGGAEERPATPPPKADHARVRDQAEPEGQIERERAALCDRAATEEEWSEAFSLGLRDPHLPYFLRDGEGD